MNKAIIIINSRGYLGGAQIRYLRLFNGIQNSKNDYYLIINHNLFNAAIEYGLVQMSGKVILVNVNSYGALNNIPLLAKNTVLKKQKSFYGKTLLRKLKNKINYIHKILVVYKTLSKLNIKYLYGVWEGGILAWPSKYILGFKFVYSYMDSGFSNIENKNLMNHEKLPLIHADKVDFLSKNLETVVLERLNRKLKNTIVTPCSFINYDNYFPVYPKNNIVVFSARLTKIKNPMLFLDAIDIVNKVEINEDIQFLILGDGELYNDIKNNIVQRRLDNVRMTGFVNKTYEYLQKSKVFISIQETNNYPSQSLLEAMACENAIIASDVGETRLLITEEEGVLVKLNPQSIAEAIIRLFSEQNLMESLAKSARNKAINEHNIEKYMEYFYSLEK